MVDSNNGVSSVEAVLFGAMASGVNRPTWFFLKMTFALLGCCLTIMLALAFLASDNIIIIHILFLVIIASSLFFLINSFLAQTGLVTIEQQMKEIGMTTENQVEPLKKN